MRRNSMHDFLFHLFTHFYLRFCNWEKNQSRMIEPLVDFTTTENDKKTAHFFFNRRGNFKELVMRELFTLIVLPRFPV